MASTFETSVSRTRRLSSKLTSSQWLKYPVMLSTCEMSREKILGAVWGYDYYGNTRTVDIHVLRLRKKLGLDNEIRTIFKIGYIFEIQE